jgi:cyanate permease
MGLYFTMQYLLAVVGPIIAGYMANLTGSSRIAFDLGAAMLAACFLAFWIYERMQNRRAIEIRTMA